MRPLSDITFIGFGEAASAFLQGWRSVHLTPNVKAFDIKTQTEAAQHAKLADYKTKNITGCLSSQEATTGTEAIFSMVTADQAAEAAINAAKYIEQGQFYFDCNSCAPETKKANAKIINAAGGRYVDVAVMAPVHPKLHHSPLLICGEYAADALDVFEAMDMKATIVKGEIGQSSSIKMVRSIMMKGLEALSAECFLSARKLGIEQTVMDSLEKTYPDFGWHTRVGYMLERMQNHGIRRAAEMREVALTIEQLGLNNGMTKAAVEWQQTIGDMDIDLNTQEFEPLADVILNNLEGIE